MTYDYDDEVGWREAPSGNQVLIKDDRIAATVFHPRGAARGVWRIIINRAQAGYIVQNEYFTCHAEAQRRAEAIMNGAPATLKTLRDRR